MRFVHLAVSEASSVNVQEVCMMEETIDSATEQEREPVRVRAWRAEQLQRLGISNVIASAAANVVDWHEVDCLIQKGCSPELALHIAR
jgi:hypothetical protein